MHIRSFITALGLAATTSALLLPPDLPISDSDTITTLPVPSKVDVDAVVSKIPSTQTLALKCPGCLRRGRHQKHQKDIPSHLKLDFAIDSTGSADRLTVNGYELYPNPDPVGNTLVAPVLPNMADRRMGIPPVNFRGGPNRPQRIQPLGFGMQTQALPADDEGDDLNLVNIEIQIIEVGNVFVQDIPNVQVKLLTTPSGKLAIGAIETIDAKPVGSEEKQKTCSTSLCKWKTLFFEKLSHVFSFKGCGNPRAGSHSNPHFNGNHHGGPHGHGPNPYHPYHMTRTHKWGRIIMAFVSQVLLPVMIGIVAGMAASLIGMAVGTFIVFLWRTFFRRSGSRSSHRSRYARKAGQREHVIADDEKSGLMDHQTEEEAPPAYEEGDQATVETKKSENVV